jgi:hypothetical protein
MSRRQGNDTASHAGNWPYNQRRIGIEREDKGDFDGLAAPGENCSSGGRFF